MTNRGDYVLGATPHFHHLNSTPSLYDHKTPYPNSHTLRCLKLSLTPVRVRPFSPAQFSQTLETLQAWETKKNIKRERLRAEIETAEMETATFHPLLAPNTLRIMKEQDMREALQSTRQEVSLGLKDSVAKALGRLKPGTKTHFDKKAFVAVSLPGSRHGSPGPQQVAARNGRWLQARNHKIEAQKHTLPPGATFSPRVNKPPRREQVSYNQSTKATLKAEEGKFDSLRSLSPVSQSVSYKAGLDLASFMQRAQPLVAMKDLGLKPA